MNRTLAIFAVVTLATFTAPQDLGAAAGQSTRAHKAGAYFARDIVARADQGWHLLWLNVGGRGDQLRIELTMGKEKQAEKFTLSFSSQSGSLLTYRSQAALVPQEKRQYVIERDLIATLRDGPIKAIEFGCVHPYLESAELGVALDPDAYYRVLVRASGKAAQRRLASEIAKSLEAGGHFGGGDQADKQTVAFTVVAQDTREMRARLDKRGRVQSLEVRSYPLPHMRRRHRHGDRLAKKLRSGQLISGVKVSGDDITLELAGGKKVVLVSDDFEMQEEECGC